MSDKVTALLELQPGVSTSDLMESFLAAYHLCISIFSFSVCLSFLSLCLYALCFANMVPLAGINQQASSRVSMSNAGSPGRAGCVCTVIIFSHEKLLEMLKEKGNRQIKMGERREMTLAEWRDKESKEIEWIQGNERALRYGRQTATSDRDDTADGTERV